MATPPDDALLTQLRELTTAFLKQPLTTRAEPASKLEACMAEVDKRALKPTAPVVRARSVLAWWKLASALPQPNGGLEALEKAFRTSIPEPLRGHWSSALRESGPLRDDVELLKLSPPDNLVSLAEAPWQAVGRRGRAQGALPFLPFATRRGVRIFALDLNQPPSGGDFPVVTYFAERPEPTPVADSSAAWCSDWQKAPLSVAPALEAPGKPTPKEAALVAEIRGKTQARGLTMGPTVSAEDLNGIETRLGVRLPPGFREFVLQVGTQPPGPWEQAEGWLGSPARNLWRPFPLTEDQEVDVELDPEEEAFLFDGLLHLGISQGATWMLVVTGAARGELWVTGDEGLRRVGPFLETYLAALDKGDIPGGG